MAFRMGESDFNKIENQLKESIEASRLSKRNENIQSLVEEKKPFR